MTRTLTFPIGPALATLVTHSASVTTHWPTFEQMFEGACRRDGKDVGVDEVARTRDWPTAADIDHAKVPAGLVLVKDHGVYLMSNGLPELLAVPSDPAPGEHSARKVVYAQGLDPKRDADWYGAAHAVCGGDDFAMHLPLDWFARAIDSGSSKIRLKLEESSIKAEWTPSRPSSVTRSAVGSVADTHG